MALPHTKFVAPPTRPEHILRARQLALIDPGARLLLLSAPAGYGKSTLAGQWVAVTCEECPTAWVQLAPEDNQVFAFWIAILSGLNRLTGELGRRSLDALTCPVADLEAIVLGPLILDLCSVAGPVALVLDDFHVITEPACHTSLAWFIEHGPPTLRLAIATRSDPVLPLGRMRARGELTELRADELRFDAAEVETFFNERLGLELEPGHVQALDARTEGWPAGLYLAALSLRGVEDRTEFVSAFAGDDQLVVDYLAPEILRGLDGALRSFLVRTSILDRLTAALCDAVLGAARGSADEILAELERSNMFLVSLDRRREWFRYHLLFRDLLRAELERTEPELAPQLHRRAAAWHHAHGTGVEGIAHDIAAGDRAAAAGHLAADWLTLYQRDSWPSIPAWLAALPEHELAAVPGFAVAKMWMSGLNGDHGELRRLAAVAREHDGGEALPDGSTSTESALATLDAFFIQGDTGRARAAALRAADLDRSEIHAPTIASALGTTAFWAGVPEHEARAILGRVVQSSGPQSTSGRVALAYAHLAYLEALRGHVGGARRHADIAVEIANRSRKYERPFMCVVRIADGWVALLESRHEQAECELDRALELARVFDEPLHVANTLRLLAHCRSFAGDRTAALVYLEEAEAIAASCTDPGLLRTLVEATAAEIRSTDRRPASAVRGQGAGAGAGAGGGAGAEPLSAREREVLRLLGGSLPLAQIASEMFVSHNTIKTHCKTIYRKLGVGGRKEALARARELGLR